MKIVQDFRAFTCSGGAKKKIATVCFNSCFHSVCLYRISSFFYSCHLEVISKIIWYINRMLYHVDIDYRADLAGGFVLIHGLGTVIGSGVCSEGKLTVYQGVTLGGCKGHTRIDENGKVWGQPLLKPDVKIYTGAGVFGPVVVGEGTEIKAMSIITHDI